MNWSLGTSYILREGAEHLAQAAEMAAEGQHVIAALPFVGTPTHAVVGAQAPEPSGDDQAVYRVAQRVEGQTLLSGDLVAQPADAVAPTDGSAQYLGLFATPLAVL